MQNAFVPLNTHDPNTVLLASPDPNRIAETLVALANTNGGMIVANGADTAATRELVSRLASQCQPAITAEELDSEASADRLCFYVGRSDTLHAVAEGRVLGRTRAGNQQLNGEQIRHLLQLKILGDFEREPVPGATFDDLDFDLICQFIDKAGGGSTDPDKYLVHIGALTPQGQATVCGILLFAAHPTRWLPQANVVLTRFVGKRSGTSQKAQQTNFSGPLFRLVEALHAHIMQDLASNDSIPEWVVQEGIVNSLVHRDYRLNFSTDVNLYDDCLEILTPGQLPGFATPETLADHQFQRNPVLFNTLAAWGLVGQQRGGLRQMQSFFRRTNQRPAQMSSKYNRFRMTFYRNGASETYNTNSAAIRINSRQKRALEYIQERGSITHRAFRALCSDTSAQTLQRDLAVLVEKQVLVKITSAKEVVYILNTANTRPLVTGD